MFGIEYNHSQIKYYSRILYYIPTQNTYGDNIIYYYNLSYTVMLQIQWSPPSQWSILFLSYTRAHTHNITKYNKVYIYIILYVINSVGRSIIPAATLSKFDHRPSVSRPQHGVRYIFGFWLLYIIIMVCSWSFFFSRDTITIIMLFIIMCTDLPPNLFLEKGRK